MKYYPTLGHHINTVVGCSIDSFIFVKNPAASSSLTFEQLSSLKSAGFSLDGIKQKFEELSMEELPEEIKPKVIELRSLQKEHDSINASFNKELFELELKYDQKYNPLYSQRSQIVKSGISNFWLTVLKNCFAIGEMITEADEEALSSLIDIRCKRHLDNIQSFTLEFVFSTPNGFFTNEVLTKSFLFNKDQDELSSTSYSMDGANLVKAEGCTIDWLPSKNLSVKVVKKTQRHKTKNITRTVEKEELCDTFFSYFKTLEEPAAPKKEQRDQERGDDDDNDSIGDDSADDTYSEYQQALEVDYEIGDLLRTKIIPNAINWFLGLADDETAPYDNGEGEDFDEDGCCDGHSDDHDHSDVDDEIDEKPEKSKSYFSKSSGILSQKAKNPTSGSSDCKQQ